MIPLCQSTKYIPLISPNPTCPDITFRRLQLLVSPQFDNLIYPSPLFFVLLTVAIVPFSLSPQSSCRLAATFFTAYRRLIPLALVVETFYPFHYGQCGACSFWTLPDLSLKMIMCPTLRSIFPRPLFVRPPCPPILPLCPLFLPDLCLLPPDCFVDN